MLFFVVVLTFGVIWVVPTNLLFLSSTKSTPMDHWFFIIVFGTMITMLTHVIEINLGRAKNHGHPFVFDKKEALLMLKDGNPCTVILWWIPVCIIKLVQMVVPLTVVLCKVFKRTFILIHSEIRLLCMADAMLGALVGYYCGNALVGGLAGAILGVLNYKLVSVRWLKLVRA